MSCNCSSTPVKIVMSCGLCLCAVIHACTIATVDKVAIPAVENLILDKTETVTPFAPPGGINFDSARFGQVNSLPVNDSARDEIKQQIFGRRIQNQRIPNTACLDCTIPQSNPVPFKPPAPTPAPTPTPPAKPTGEMNPVKVAPRFSIEIFVSDDQQSQEIRKWFANNETLIKWRTTCNFNEYTQNNGLYLGRYSEAIPASSFPVVLVTGPDGGVVCVFDKCTIPSSDATLVKDISEKTKLYQSLQAQLTQPLPLIGPPRTQISSNFHPQPDWIEDCPGGICPPDRLGFLRPNRDSSANVNPAESLLR